jgi:uncharacterized repeat protein (TIGR01451 family)
MLLLLGGFASGAAASDSCTYTPSPSGWRQQGEVYYRLVMDHTWLFVPTGHIQIQPVSFTFPVGGKVKAVASFSATPLPLFADPDLHSPKGTEPTYPAGSGFLDYWFWANFQPGASSVTLTHTPTDSTPVSLNWTVNVQCNSPGGLGVAPESAFDIEGTIGGPFEPASQTYGLANSGSSTINYSISASYASAAGWLSLSPTSGSLGAGQSGSFAATVNSLAAGLATGTYGATIEIRTSGANPQTITRAVSLSIQPGPSLPPVISGRITTTDGAPLEGVRMDGLPSVKWTDGNGEYSVFVGTGWSGTVRPSKAGFSFTPPNRTYSAVTAGVSGQDYIAAPKTYTLSGRVTLDGQGLPGVTMTGLPGDPVTGQNGDYLAIVPFHWSGTVIPEAPGYELSPASMTYAEVGMDRVDENYLAVQRTATLSGRVTYGSSGLAGVWLNGLPGSVVTAADGTYAAAVPYGASGMVTPGANGYVFSPISLDFVDLVEDLPAQNFTASQAPAGSGRLWIVATSAELQQANVFSRSGDMVLVKPGTYLNVDLGSLDPGTVLVSEAGADQTILEVSQFVVNMSDVVIEGFTFRTSGTSEPLHITGSSNVRLRNCRIIAPGTTYGVRITNAQNLLIEGSVFSGYAGILLRSGSSTGTLTLRNNHFLNQTSGLLGGSNPSLQVILENNLFRNITQVAADLDLVGSLASSNNLFTGNGTGMDISSITGAVQLRHDTLVNNGTAYRLSGTISVVIYNSILQGNNRGIDGGGSATISVHHLMPWQNTSWLYGSAHYILDESTIWEVNPQFVNASTGDYHLATGSPARGVGQGGADLGAYGGALGTAWKTPPGAPPAPPALLSILVTGLDRINPGDIVTFLAKASFENGYSSPYATFNNVAQWSSSAPTVLESQGAGRFRAVRPGAATVTARSGSVSTSLPVTVLAPALVLTAADTADPVAAGGTVTYELLATNHGEGIARHLQITAQLDAQTSFVSASPAPDAGTSNRWTLGDLQTGETAGVSIIVGVNAGAAGATLSFSSGATADFATAAAASEVTTVSGTPDLQIGAGITPSEVRPGGLVAATLTFRNEGSAAARDVIVEATYPFGLDFRSAVPAPSSGTGTWFVGTLARGETRTISIELAAASAASGTLVMAAEIRNSDGEMMPADNQASASVGILAVADLEVSVTDSPDPVILGHPVLYEVTVTNQGPSTATGVTLLADLPEGLELVSAVPEQGSCSSAPPIACQLGSLPAGTSAGVAITANPTTTGTVQMDSSVSGNEEDPEPEDNLSSASTEVLETASGLDFYTLPPCRVLDTRLSEALASQVPRSIPVAGLCGVPATAQAVALNVTVVSPSGPGNVSLWPADLPWPMTSVINFSTGQTRANNAIVGLATDGGGDLAAQAFVGGGGTVHLVLDVSGYFQ